MPGPLPQAERRRRNAPTIPTTNLPAGGRDDPPPRLPAWIHLGKSGRAWWRWAWATPQAAAWSDGFIDLIARRASLEDDLEVLADTGRIDLEVIDDEELRRNVRALVSTLKALAGGRLAVMKEMREIDHRLGLTPKGLADLRWVVVDDTPVAPVQLHAVPDEDRFAHLGA